MIALILGFIGFGLLGIVAYGVVILALGRVCGVFYWTWRLAQFILRMALRVVVDVCRRARFTIPAAAHLGADPTRLIRSAGRLAFACSPAPVEWGRFSGTQ